MVSNENAGASGTVECVLAGRANAGVHGFCRTGLDPGWVIRLIFLDVE